MRKGPTAAVVMALTLCYVKASLIYLLLGGTLLLLTFSRILSVSLTAFYFIELYGFVAMMIFGISYLFIPSFAHGFLHSLRIAKFQFWLMNAGVVGLFLSFSGLLPNGSNIELFVLTSLVILVAALYLHAYNLWQTMRAWKGSPGEQLSKAS